MALVRNLTSFSTRRRACLSFLETLATLLGDFLAFVHTQVTFSKSREVCPPLQPLPKRLEYYAIYGALCTLAEQLGIPEPTDWLLELLLSGKEEWDDDESTWMRDPVMLTPLSEAMGNDPYAVSW
jgi:hypothetical protein